MKCELWFYQKGRGRNKGQGQGYHGQGRIDKSLHWLRRHVEDKSLGYHRGVQSHGAVYVTGTTIGQIPNYPATSSIMGTTRILARRRPAPHINLCALFSCLPALLLLLPSRLLLVHRLQPRSPAVLDIISSRLLLH